MNMKIVEITEKLYKQEIDPNEAERLLLDLFAVMQRNEQLAISALKIISENEREQFSAWEAKNALKEIADCV